MTDEENDRPAEERVMPRWHLLAHGRCKRPHDGVHHHGHDGAPGRHRRREARHHHAAFGDDHFERAEGFEKTLRAFVTATHQPGPLQALPAASQES